jgi:hypothetical protein
VNDQREAIFVFISKWEKYSSLRGDPSLTLKMTQEKIEEGPFTNGPYARGVPL